MGHFRGKEFGGVSVQSVQAMALAARFRAATVTMCTVEENKKAWDEAKRSSELLAISAGILGYPGWWDSPPLIEGVWEAKQQYGNRYGDLRGVVEAAAPATGGGGDSSNARSKRFSPQNAVYKHLVPFMFPYNCPADVARRIRLWTRDELPGLELEVRAAYPLLTRLPPTMVLSVMKGWYNGLPTNFRMHKEKRVCIFCKASEDRLLHILQCPMLCSAVAKVVQADYRPNVLQNLGLAEHPSISRLQMLKYWHLIVDLYQNARDASGCNPEECVRGALKRARMLAHDFDGLSIPAPPHVRRSNRSGLSTLSAPATPSVSPAMRPVIAGYSASRRLEA
jgi:hypothetical protein